jgi:SAM-dependent methyltransferase
MPMTQEDIKNHYRNHWGKLEARPGNEGKLETCGPVEERIIAPIYRQAIGDHRMRADEGDVLDVGSGSGRWVGFFLRSFKPRSVVGLDITDQAVRLLTRWYPSTSETNTEFIQGDITDQGLALESESFDIINISRVLFHIPETNLYLNALRNLARLVRPTGFILTTEYLPRMSMRTEFMLLHNRYTFESLLAQAGLRIVDIRACSFFVVDPMGLDGPDDGIRQRFWSVQNRTTQLLANATDPETRKFLIDLFADIEKATLDFCHERIADIDMPSQKLVILERMH